MAARRATEQHESAIAALVGAEPVGVRGAVYLNDEPQERLRRSQRSATHSGIPSPTLRDIITVRNP